MPCHSSHIYAEAHSCTILAELAYQPVIAAALQNGLAYLGKIAPEHYAGVVSRMRNDTQVYRDLSLEAQSRQALVFLTEVFEYPADLIVCIYLLCPVKNLGAAEKSGQLFQSICNGVVADLSKQVIEGRIVLCGNEHPYVLTDTLINVKLCHKLLEIAYMSKLQPEIFPVKLGKRCHSRTQHLIVGSLAVAAANELYSCHNVLIGLAF